MGHHHDHGTGHASSKLRLTVSAGLTLALVIAEVVAGLQGHSLALLTDAAHNLTDVLALGLSGYAFRAAEQPAHAGKTYGYHRVGILVALFNSSTLVVIAAGIFQEAYHRFLQLVPVMADVLVGMGGVAFLVNVLTAWLVSHGHRHDLNLRSAYLHLLGDVFSTLGAVAAGIGIWLTGLHWLDPAASVLIGLLILWNAWIILRETLDILLESTPRDIDMSAMVRDLMALEGVRGVHDLHVWSISQSLRMLSAHIVTDDITLHDGAAIQHRINDCLVDRYNIAHTTLQLECEGCEPDLLYCDITHARHGHAH
ncbi:cation diffusion facilitator family transporter [Methylococcus sp. EFPC2]|uniref:cation diffusion facilitator family transporter n=1 Tax=Methylococcus sp. EFPC2 TaxID=2812648 RepID=UPI0019689531|nr:cation diffusion facilitator family transporter [Methylococcus sp. EFPC2]QSA98556.1 cation transporter [Methylococcus sp. EFPC2]